MKIGPGMIMTTGNGEMTALESGHCLSCGSLQLSPVGIVQVIRAAGQHRLKFVVFLGWRKN